MSPENKPNKNREFDIDKEGRISSSDKNLNELSEELTSEELTPEKLDEIAGGSNGIGCSCGDEQAFQ